MKYRTMKGNHGILYYFPWAKCQVIADLLHSSIRSLFEARQGDGLVQALSHDHVVGESNHDHNESHS